MSKQNGHRNFHDDVTEIVSYIYGEMDERSRSAFEAHLTHCDECISELAAFADARLGVVEWRREDFDALVTPKIFIPETTAAVIVPQAAGNKSIFADFADSVMTLPLFARMGVGLAAAALLIAAIYLGTPKGPDNAELAVNSNSRIEEPQPKVYDVSTVPSSSTVRSDIIADDNKAKQDAPGVVQRAVSVSRGSAASRQMRVSPPVHNQKRNSEIQATRPAPRLNTFPDDDDKSLRLTDLFAEIGTSDE